MSNPQPAPPITPSQPPPPAAPDRPGGERERPWWGLGDILLAVPFVLVFAFAGVVIAFVVAALIGEDLSFDDMQDAAALPTVFVAISALGQQLGQTVWPWVVTKWKGVSMARDWGWAFKPIDVLIGLGVGVVGVGLAAAVGEIVSRLVSIEDAAEADNTQILTDAEGSPWLFAILFVVLIGAPVSEELLFRGLVLRAFEKRGGPILAIIGSTIAFTVVHYTGSSLDGTLVLFASIGTIGLLLGVVTWRVGRLAPAIIAHVLFNSVGTLVSLFG